MATVTGFSARTAYGTLFGMYVEAREAREVLTPLAADSKYDHFLGALTMYCKLTGGTASFIENVMSDDYTRGIRNR